MIFLEDHVRPVITVQDISVSFHYGDTINLTTDNVVVSVEDNCDPDVSLAMSQVVITCEDFMTDNEVLIEITATDDQGNQTIEEIIVTLVGGLFIMDCPDDIQVSIGPGECGAVVELSLIHI